MRSAAFGMITVHALVLTFLFSSIASGNELNHPANDIWDPVSAGPITAWAAPVCEKGKLAVQPFFFYNRIRGAFNEEGHYKSYTNKDRRWEWQEQLFLQYGITDKFELDGLGTYQQNIAKVNGQGAESAGFNDTYLYARYCIFEDRLWVPCTTLLFQLKLPTGKYQKADDTRLGTDIMCADSPGGGSYDHGYGVILSKKLKPCVFHADFIYTFPIHTKVDGVKANYANYINYDFGLEYFLPRGFNLMVECNCIAEGDRKDNGERVPASETRSVTLGSGIGWSNDKIQTLFSYQRTVAGENVDCKDSFVFTFVCTF